MDLQMNHQILTHLSEFQPFWTIILHIIIMKRFLEIPYQLYCIPCQSPTACAILFASYSLQMLLYSGRIIITNNLMNYVFGGGKPQPPQYPQQPTPPQYNQPQQPTIQIETLQKKSQNKCRELSEVITVLEKEAAELFMKAKQSKGSSHTMYKDRCAQVLKKKKMYEQQLKAYMNQQNMLDQVNFTKENIKNTIQMGQVMQQTVEVQKNLMKHVDIDRLEDIRDEMDEMKFQSDYTNELLNRNFDVGMDDIDLDAEMQEIDNDFYREVMTNKPQKAVNVPNQQMNNNYYGGMQNGSMKQ